MEEQFINYYELIGVSPQASEKEIKEAFVIKARPLIEAYQVLSDSALRARYDAILSGSYIVADGFAVPWNTAATAAPLTEEILQNLLVTLDGTSVVTDEKSTRRLLTRIPVDKTIVVTLADRTAITGKLADLSGSGARLELDAALNNGQIVDVGVGANEPPFAQAQVVRIVKPGHEYGVKWIRIFESHLPKGFLSKKTI